MMLFFFFFLMIRRPPRSTRTDTLFPYTTLFRSKRSLSEGLRYPARRLPHLFQIDIRTVIRMLAEIVDIFRDTGGVVPKSRTDAIQVIANVGFRTPLADHAVDGGVGTRKGGIVRQAAVAAHLGLVGRLRRLGRGRGGHDIALVVRFQRGARIDRLQLLLTEILGQWRDAPGRVGNAAEIGDGLGPSLASKVANALYFALNFLVRVPTIGNIRAIVDRQFASGVARSEEHTSELQSLMRISYAVFCLKKKTS